MTCYSSSADAFDSFSLGEALCGFAVRDDIDIAANQCDLGAVIFATMFDVPNMISEEIDIILDIE